MTVGARLKEERKRLGQRQEDLAQACGVSRSAQILFEKGEHLPGGAYLIAADAQGVDVLYVLTGKRGNPPAQPRAEAAKVVFHNADIQQQFNAPVDLRGQRLVVKGGAKSKGKTAD